MKVCIDSKIYHYVMMREEKGEEGKKERREGGKKGGRKKGKRISH